VAQKLLHISEHHQIQHNNDQDNYDQGQCQKFASRGGVQNRGVREESGVLRQSLVAGIWGTNSPKSWCTFAECMLNANISCKVTCL